MQEILMKEQPERGSHPLPVTILSFIYVFLNTAFQ